MVCFKYVIIVEHLMANHILRVKCTGQCVPVTIESGRNGLHLEKYALSVSP